MEEGVKMAKGMSSLAIGAASSAMNGKKILSTLELAEKRLVICEKCPSLAKDSGRCMECGCFVKAKARISFEECPLEKW